MVCYAVGSNRPAITYRDHRGEEKKERNSRMRKEKGAAFVSVYNKEGIDDFVRSLLVHGFGPIISSRGTAKYLASRGLALKDVSEISGLGAILDHRVVTLVPQVHGGLLAKDTPEHLKELAEIRGIWIDVACVDVYPLAEELARPGHTLESVIENTDIGGPTALMSAVKGARFPICNETDRNLFVHWLEAGEPKPEYFGLSLRANAAQFVSAYYGKLASYLRSVATEQERVAFLSAE
jgi:phosphoribosylaminoimidazolecarboxamide formyltransferase / IMP cyclohydrolase